MAMRVFSASMAAILSAVTFAGEPVLDQFIGESGAGSLVVGKNIIAVSGATVSTKGINMGANAALAVAELLG